MERKQFLQTLFAFSIMNSLTSFKNFTDTLPTQSKKMPVLFTSHGSRFDIPLTKEQWPFWNTLYELGAKLQNKYEVKAALIVSDH